MDPKDKEAILKILQALLSYGIQALGSLIPFLSTLTGIPVVGWIIGLGVGLLAKWLAKLILIEIRFRNADRTHEAIATEENFKKFDEIRKREKEAQTAEEKAKLAKEKADARKALEDAVAKLIDLRLKH